MRTAPSKKALMDTFRFDGETADAIRNMWKGEWTDDFSRDIRTVIERVHQLHHGHLESRRYGRQLAVDVLGEFHGVEYLGKNRHGQDVDYLNAGDTYTPTLIFVGDRMFISCWGQLVESGYIKESDNPY